MPPVKNIKSIIFYAFLLITCCGSHLSAQAPVSREYQVKAAFIFNFTQFVEWPSLKLADDNSPFVIGVLGKDPFGSYLDDIIENEKIMDHPIVVERYTNIEGVKNCQVLFVNMDCSKQTFEDFHKENILTVGDAYHFAHSGGIVSFFTENGKIRFEINLSEAKAASLNISSKLLRVAKIKGK